MHKWRSFYFGIRSSLMRFLSDTSYKTNVLFSRPESNLGKGVSRYGEPLQSIGLILPLCPHSLTAADQVVSDLTTSLPKGTACWLLVPHSTASAVIDSLRKRFHGHGGVSILRLREGKHAWEQELLAQIHADYIVFLDLDGDLSMHALREAATYLQEHPETDLLYFDQDEIDLDTGWRSQPWFKPDWSPELLFSVDYLQPCVMRRSLLQATSGLEFNWDEEVMWSLHLEASRHARHVAHIPKVLYHKHRRMSGQAPGRMEREKGSRAKRKMYPPARFLERRGRSDIHARFHARSHAQLLWKPAARLVTVVIPTRDNLTYLRPCLEGLWEHTSYKAYEILLIDTGSQDADAISFYGDLEKQEQARTVRLEGPFNYSKTNNFGASNARGDLLLFLNDDVQAFETGWMEEMVRWCTRDEIGVVGAKLLFSDGLIQHSGVVIGLGGLAGHVFRGMREGEVTPFGSPDWYRNLSAVTGACMMTRREVFDQIGGFDERFRLAYGDVDFCLRAVAEGYRVLYTPFARLIHHEGRSRGRRTPRSDLKLARRRFAGLLEGGDPYFNPNLSLRSVMPWVRLFGTRLRRLTPGKGA
jgi:GT2 family glycosyltransferase